MSRRTSKQNQQKHILMSIAQFTDTLASVSFLLEFGLHPAGLQFSHVLYQALKSNYLPWRYLGLSSSTGRADISAKRLLNLTWFTGNDRLQ